MNPLEQWLTEGKRRGLIGPEPLERTLSHARALGAIALDGMAPASTAPPPPCLDLGSGGGVPGLILACDWPDSTWVLLDSNLRSGEFLAEATAGLGLGDRVTVLTARAETMGRDPAHRARYGLVTARAIASPAVVAEYAAPLLRPSGVAVISDPPGASASRWDEEGLAQLGLSLDSHRVDPVAAAVLRQAGELPQRFPRRPGIARKRPLWG